MKSFVVGAMLLRTMNAQIVPAADTIPAVSANALPDIPGAAPAVPLDSTSAPAISPTLGGAAIVGTALQNSAPAIIDQLPSASPAPAADFSAFAFPEAPIVSAPADTAPIDLAPVSTAPVDASPIAAPIDASPIAAPIDASPIAAPIDASPIAAPVDATPVDAVPIDAPVDVSSSVIVDASPIQTTSPADVTPTLLPVGAALPIGSNPYIGPFDPNSIYDPNSPYYDPYATPPGWEGYDNGIYDGEYNDAYQGAQPPVYDYDEDEECPAWCIPEDDDYSSYPTSTPDSEYTPVADPYAADPYVTTSYQADPYAADPTPYADYPQQDSNYPPAEPQYYPEPEDNSYPQLKKVRSILRAVRRQVFNWPQSSYSDDDESGYYDGEDGSIPDWLYDISGAPKRPNPTPKPTCPQSCYKPKTTDYGYDTKPARPTYTKTRKGGYQTTDDSYYSDPTSDASYYPDETTDAPYPGDTSKAWYPQDNTTVPLWPTGFTDVPDVPTSIPDEATSVPDEATSVPDEATSVPNEATQAPYEPTTLVTQYQSQPYPEQTGGASSNPGSPAGDYTGETLDTVCPNTCNPFNPAENFCDVTTGCATTGGSKYYCACRAGFRADNYNAKDFSKQFRVAGQPYVYLAVSTSCNTPCSDQTCSEVLERSQCK